MIIQHNIMALNSHRQLKGNNGATSKSLEKLSSGFKINRAGDDAAGLAISEKMRAQIKGLETAQANAQDAISLVQTAEGGLQEVHSILNRMTELATKASNGTYDSETDRAAIQNEATALSAEINRIASGTNFNGIKLLNGELGAATKQVAGYTQAALNTAFGGANQSQALVTGVSGITLGSKTDRVTMAANANGNLDITIRDSDNNAVTTSLDLSTLITAKDGTAYTAAAGAEGVIDLTSVGLGKISFTATSNTATAANFVTDLSTAFTGGAAVTDVPGGAPGNGLILQIGDTADAFNQLTVSITNMSADTLQVENLDLTEQASAKTAIDTIKAAINQVSEQRGKLGAAQNRLEHTINNLGVTTENVTAAESRIRDVDMAKEMMDFTKNNVLMQSAQAMLAQANQQPQSILQLLR